MKSFYYFLVGISLLAFGFSGVATSIDAHLGLVYSENPSPRKQEKPQPKKYKEAKGNAKITHFSLLTGEITTTDALALIPTITATKTVAVQGGGNPIPGSQLNYTVVINNTASGVANNATDVTFTDVLVNDLTLVGGSVKATPIGVNDAYDVIGNVGITVPAGSGVLTNDVSPDGTTITATLTTASANGTLTLSSNGAFTYTPNVGYSGTDSFVYTVVSTNGTTSTNNTVTLTVSAPIWFVNIAATTSTNAGTLANPFKDWSDFATSNAISGTVNPAVNQTIFVYSGTYSGKATLKTGQKVLGQGATTSLASFAGVTPTFSNTLPTTSGTNPNLTSSGGTTITIPTTSFITLRGFDMGNSTTDIASGASFGTLTTSEMALNGNGQALNLQSGALNASFTSISSTNSAAEGIRLLSVSGTLTSTGGTTITNSTSDGIGVYSASSVNANFGNTNVTGSGGAGLFVSGSTSNTAALTFGDLDIAPDAAQNAINYFGRGSLTCTSGTITTSNTPGTTAGIGIAGGSAAQKVTLSMVLNSFSITGNAGTLIGLDIQNTLGSFAINGTGTTAGSGGTISTIQNRGVQVITATNITLKNMNFVNANTVGGTAFSTTDISGSNAGIYFNDVNGVSLDNIQMNTTTGNVNAQNGITLYNVTNFNLANSTITRCGTSNEEACIMAVNTSGTCTISNSTISKASRCARFTNNSKNMTLKVTGSSFNDTRTFIDPVTPTPDAQLNPDGGSGILFEGYGSSVMSLDVKSACNFLRIATGGVEALATDNAVVSADVQNSTFNATNANLSTGEDVGIGVRAQSGVSATVKFNFLNNTITGRGGDLINVGATGAGRMEGTIDGNTIIYNFKSTINNNAGNGIGVVHASTNTTSRVKINNNTITNIAGSAGISANVSGGSNGRADIICTNNNVTLITSLYGTLTVSPVNYGFIIGSVGTSTICSKVANNTSNAGALGIARIRAAAAGDIHLVEGSGLGSDNINNLETIWNNLRTTGTTASAGQIVKSGLGTHTLSAVGTCASPSNPLINLSVPSPVLVENLPKELPTESINQTEAVDTLAEEKISTEAKSSTESTNSSAKIAAPLSGETVTINGAGSGFSLPAGKSTTVTFSATVSSTPSTCVITNQASVSGSNFTTVNSNTTTTNLVVPPTNPGSTINATSVCSGGSITLGAVCPSGSQLKWFTASSGGSSVSTSSPYSPTNITAATSYYASCTIGGCESARTLVGSVTINPLPTITVSASPAICAGVASFTIPYTGTTGTPTTYSISGTGITTVTNAALPATPITVNISDVGGATGSSYSYTLTVRNANGCISNNVTGSVTVNPAPTITVSASPAICTGATSFTIPYTATTGTPTTYSISGTGITTVTNAALPATPITVNLSAGASGTSILYTLTIKNAGNCTSSNVTGSVTVNALPTLTISGSPNICTGATSFTIPYTATTETPTTYSISGTGITTVTDAALPVSPIIVNLSSGASGPAISYTLTVKNSNGCKSSNITSGVNVNTLPTLTKSASPAICAGATSFTIPFTATTGTPTTFSISGTGITSVTDAALPATPITVNLSSGASGSSISYTLTVKNAAGCTSGNITGSVTVNSTPAPTAPTATPSSRTTAGSVTLSATGCVGGTLTWFNASTNVAVPSPNNQPNFTSSGTFNFYAKCTGTNTCVSDASVNVPVTVSLCTPLGASPGNVDITWTGLLSSDWNTACNWSPAWVPDVTNGNVIIGNTTNKPIITTGNTATVKAIKINNGGIFTVNIGATLNIRGNGVEDNGIEINDNASMTNNGTVKIESATQTAILASIYLRGAGNGAFLFNNGTIVVNSTDAGIGVGVSSGSYVTNNPTGIITIENGTGIGVSLASDQLQFDNKGTINYNGSGLAMSLQGNTSFAGSGTFNINSGTGISNISPAIIETNPCGKILMASGTFVNTGTTTNNGLLQMPNAYDFTNTGTFTNGGVLKANTVSGITNNQMVITNACPIFTLAVGGSTYTVSGIFTDAAATTSAGTYTSVGNKFTANNTIPTGTQTLYAQVTNVPAEGFCTFVVPFDFNNVKPTAVSISNTAICTGGSITLSATCASGTPTWYTVATGGASIGTGTSLANSPTVTTNYYVACEATNCVSGRVATNAVSIATLPTASASSNSPICAGTTLNLTGGAAGNTYSWAGPNSFTSMAQSPTIASVTSLATGTYTITVTNANNCTATATVAVTVNAVPTATASSNSPVCAGNSISLTSGGVGTYLWAGPGGYSSVSQSPTIANATVGATGTYTITVTNVSGCTSTALVAVTVNALPTATASSNSPICAGTALNLTGGGVGTYSWTSSNGFTSTAQSPTIANATVSASGTYTITVTNVSGCTSTASVAVTVNALPTATASSNSPICAGNTLNLTGTGTGTYAWSGPNGFTSSALNPTIPNATTLATGTYTISVTNTNNCVFNATTAVTVNANPTATASSNSPICAGTTLNLTGGGVGTYSWTSSNGFTSTAQSPTIANATVSSTGTYTITVTNANGCTSTASVAVTVNANPTATASSSTPTICTGNSISLTGGGIGTYAWAGPNGYSSTAQSPTISNATVLATGTYTITVRNASNCTSTATVAVTVNANPTATASSNSPVCAGATLNLTSGGGGSYAWTGPVITNPMLSTTQNPSISNITNAASGIYTVRVTNTNGCTSTATIAVIVNATPTATASSSTPTICAGNSISLTGGGVGSYLWNGPNGFSSNLQSPTIASATVSATGTYTITVTGTGSCTSTATTAVTVNALPTATASSNTPVCVGNTINLIGGGGGTYAWIGVNGFTSTDQNPTITNASILASGTYKLTVTNVSGCTSTAMTSVTVNPTPTATASSNSPICAGTTLNLTGGGVGTYSWTGVNGFNSTDQNPSIPNASILASGTYRVTVTNINGCAATAQTSVTVNAIPTATAISNSPVCVGNTISLTGGGVGSYLWTGPNTYTSTAQSPSIANAIVSASGTYTITVTNANNCTSTATVVVTVNANPSATASSNTPICAGTTLNLTGGGVGISYAWTGVNGFTSTDQNPSIPNASLLTSGTYRITVTNASGCTSTATTSVTVNANPTATASSNSPICAGTTLNLTGGGIGTYSWTSSNGFTSTAQSPTISNATVSASGTYTITVTNASGCTSTASVVVTVNALPTATASNNSPICSGITLNLTGGGIGTYSWTSSNGFTSTAQSPTISNATVSASGTYTITVTNASGCTSTATTSVTVNAIPTATASSNSPVCVGNTISLTGGGVGSYLWTGPNTYTSTAQSPSIANAIVSASGTYTITVTNANNCTSTATVVVTVNANPSATASSNTPICAGTTLNLTGGGVGISYAWTGVNGFTSTDQNPSIPNASLLASGTYRITVTNANNCTSTATTSVTVNPLPVVDAGANQTICEGSTASLTATCNLLTVSTTLSGASEVPANASTATGTVSGTFNKVTKQLLLTISFNGLTANASAAHIHKGAVGVNGGVVIGFSGVPSATSGSFTYTGTLTSTQETDLLAGLYYVNVHNSSFPGGEIRGQLSTTCVANSFVWNPGNLSGQTVTVSPSAAQLYTVTASNTSTGCSTTATTTVNVNPRPVPTIGSNTPVCAGNTLNLTVSVGSSDTPSTFAWTGSNSFTSSAQNPSVANVTVSASGTYMVMVTNVNGCTNTATTVVVINALPTATASNNSPICSGVTLNLTGGGVGTYLWSGPDGYSSTAQSPSIPSATASMSGTYTITVTNANGCTSTATTSVTVNPVVNPPVPQANTQIIFGASITLTATGCSGVNDVLKWYKSSDNTLAVMPVSPTATTNYYAKCETTLNGITCISGNSVDVTVTVLSPTPPVATGATNCIGTPTTLTATGCSGSVGTFVLKWYQNADDALVTMPVSPLVSTDYYAKCEQTFNSVTAVSAKSNVVTLTILNPPTPVSTGGTIYSGQSISLTATGCTGTLGTFTLKWYQSSDNLLVTMPVSPTVTTKYYSKCEQTANSITCLSVKSDDVKVAVVNRIFVDITKISAPIQNGNSWATAYGNLQTGLAAATPGVEVWVAKGTYKPTTTTTRTIYFEIPNSVIVYGGFAGTEDNLINRNFRTNVTILSGDIGTQKIASDNSYHVVLMNGSSKTTVLDGFTISDGYANFDPNRTYLVSNALVPTSGTIETGGGIVVQNAGMPIIANCAIIQNAAVTGGGLYAGDASKPNIIACKFMGNQAGFGSGLYFQDGSHGRINNTLISGNKGIGGVYNNFSNPIITNCTLAGNGGYSGGIFNSNSEPIVKNSIIWGNSTPFNDTQSVVTYSTIQGGYPGVGNLSMDPEYVSPMPEGISPILTGDYHVKASSLSIDRGDNGTISLTDNDLDGNLRRFSGGRVDMGAYEFQGTATATLVISLATGNWEVNSTWDIGRVPQLGDYVIIDNNHVVTLSTTGIAKNLEYRGTGKLKFNTTTSKLEIGF